MKTFLIRRRALSLAACAAAVCLMFYVINYPAAVDASASQRQLPIYCVQWPPSASTRPGATRTPSSSSTSWAAIR